MILGLSRNIGKKQISKFLVGLLILLLGGLVGISLSKRHAQPEKLENLQKYQINLDDTSVTILKIDKKTNYSNYIIIGILTLIVFLLSYNIYQYQKTSKSNFFDKLTQKETEIVGQIQKGKTNQEIADELFISVSTVKTHINNIYKKLHIKSRKDLLAKL